MQANWVREIREGLENLKSKLILFCFLVSLSLVGLAFVMWAAEGVHFLKYGTIKDFTVIGLARTYYCPSGVCAQTALHLWLYYPSDWVGLHTVLSHTDPGLFLLGLGFLILYLTLTVAQKT